MNNLDLPTSLEGIIKRLEEVHYPLRGFRACKDQRQFDRYQGAQDVIDLLTSWQAAMENRTQE